MNNYRAELIQVAAVAVAAIQDFDYGTTGKVPFNYEEIISEREFQEKKWGPQHHSKEKWLAILVEEVGEVAKDILDFE